MIGASENAREIARRLRAALAAMQRPSDGAVVAELWDAAHAAADALEALSQSPVFPPETRKTGTGEGETA